MRTMARQVGSHSSASRVNGRREGPGIALPMKKSILKKKIYIFVANKY